MFTANQIRSATLKTSALMIRDNMLADNYWLTRGILAIYARQTADEQCSEMTKHDNGIGFSGIDGQILSSFAKQIEQWNDTPADKRKYNSPLSPRQLELARRKMVKYAAQLARIVRESIEQTAPVQEPEGSEESLGSLEHLEV